MLLLSNYVLYGIDPTVKPLAPITITGIPDGDGFPGTSGPPAACGCLGEESKGFFFGGGGYACVVACACAKQPVRLWSGVAVSTWVLLPSPAFLFHFPPSWFQNTGIYDTTFFFGDFDNVYSRMVPIGFVVI